MDAQPFKCTLTASPEYRLGAPIIVKLEMQNISKEIVRFVSWGTPFAGSRPLDFLSVARDGVDLPYDGPVVGRGEPNDRDYLTLAPNESLTAEVDISLIYPFELPGEYTATLTMTLYDAYALTPQSKSRDGHQPHELERTRAVFTVTPSELPARLTTGQQVLLADVQNLLPRRRGQNLIGGTPQERDLVLKGHNAAERAVSPELVPGPLLGGNPTVAQLYTKWFGAQGQTVPNPDAPFIVVPRSSVVENIIREISRVLATQTVTYDLRGDSWCDTESAHTWSGSRTIFFCPPAFSGSTPQVWIMRDLLVHEWAHAVSARLDGGKSLVTDHAYGNADCTLLARNDPEKAIRNASNYEMFIHYLLKAAG